MATLPSCSEFIGARVTTGAGAGAGAGSGAVVPVASGGFTASTGLGTGACTESWSPGRTAIGPLLAAKTVASTEPRTQPMFSVPVPLPLSANSTV